MNNRLTRFLTGRDLVFVAIFTALSVWFYIGFYFPSLYILSSGGVPKTILWILRIVIPLLYVGVIILYISVRRNLVGTRELGILLVSVSFSMIVCYGIADALYQKRFDDYRKLYHPFLQLMPSLDRRLEGSGIHGGRIFCLGGSTTELPDRSGRDWPSRVEAILRKESGFQDVEVYNLGREWYTSLHTLINYETNLRKYRPSAIVIMQSVNDLLQNADFSYMSHGAFREDYGHFYGPVNRIIERRTLYQYLHYVLRELWYARPRTTITTDQFPGLNAYRSNIETIIEMARHDSTKVILMTEPYLMKRKMSEEEHSVIGMIKVEAINDEVVWSSETLVNGMEHYNNTLRSIAITYNLPLIDLEKEVPKSLIYFRDEVHYQDTTFSIVAPFVAHKLLEYLTPN